jgi:hypothetical protein
MAIIMSERIDLTGQKYGKLIVLGYSHTKYEKCFWKCRCECGNETIVCGRYLRTGHTKSCGCQRRNRKPIHGMAGTRIYGIWRSMKVRTNPNNSAKHPYYSGRGIGLFDEWKDFTAFYEWAMANGYRDNLSIDRIDVNGNYEPENCRWATLLEQGRNKRNNHLVLVNGEKITVSELSEKSGISNSCLMARIRRKNNLLKEPRIYVKKKRRSGFLIA